MFRLFAVHIFAALSPLLSAGEKAAPAVPPVPRAAAPEAPAPTTFVRSEALLSTETLGNLIGVKDPKLVLIDARASEAFDEGHIPGARNIISDQFQETQTPPYYMPTSEHVKKVCAENGIHADSIVAIYDQDDGRLAARVWFTLHAYGHNKAAILDGGAGKWRAENRAWGGDEPAAAAGTFTPSETLRSVCTFAELAQFRTRVHTLGKLPPTTLVDARSVAEYMGDDVRGKNGGHIPGAASIEWSGVLKGTEKQRVWRPAPEIHAILRLASIERDQKIAVYDQAGGRSAHLLFTLWLMGFDKASNYVAGWREYGNRDDVEVEK